VQQHIFHLASLSSANFFATHDIQVRWTRGALTVTKPSLLSTYEALDQFVSLSAELFVAAMHTRTSGIEFVAKSREPDTGRIAVPGVRRGAHEPPRLLPQLPNASPPRVLGVFWRLLDLCLRS
jgi:hypothetical protein